MSNLPLPQNTLQAVNATLAQVIERLNLIEEKVFAEPEPMGVTVARAKHMLLDKLEGDRVIAALVWDRQFKDRAIEQMQITESQLSQAMDKAIAFMWHEIQEERARLDPDPS